MKEADFQVELKFKGPLVLARVKPSDLENFSDRVKPSDLEICSDRVKNSDLENCKTDENGFVDVSDSWDNQTGILTLGPIKDKVDFNVLNITEYTNTYNY